jgi:hypothetical protein
MSRRGNAVARSRDAIVSLPHRSLPIASPARIVDGVGADPDMRRSGREAGLTNVQIL